MLYCIGGVSAVEEKGRSSLRRRTFFTFVDYFALGLFEFSRLLSRLLPTSWLYALFSAIGRALFHVRRGMRKDLLKKISEALPELATGEVSRIGLQACISATLPMFDLLVFGSRRREYAARLSVHGWEHLEEADAAGRGVIFLFAHIGAYGTSPAVLAHLGKPFTPVMFRPEDTPIPRSSTAIDLYGESLGCDPEGPVFWAGDDTVSRVREHLGRGRRVGIAFDVPGNCIVPLFGRPAAMADGIAHFAYDTGAPIIPFSLLRGRGVLDRRLTFYPPLAAHTSGDRKEDVKDMMREVVAAAESQIRSAPGQWMSWFGLWHWWKRAEELQARSEDSA
jgi:KDO2-lipid IV(A) lauroyltransferase